MRAILYRIFRKYVNLSVMGKNQLNTGRSFSFLVLNWILGVEESP